MRNEKCFSPSLSFLLIRYIFLDEYLDFGFICECFPSLAIWPTYCIQLSTFFSVLSNLSDLDLPIQIRKLRKAWWR